MPKDPAQCTMFKRAPLRPAVKPNDLYVRRGKPRRSLVPVVKRGIDLLMNKGYTVINVHGLGAAVELAMKAALCIQQALHNQATLHIYTSTVTLFDDCIRSPKADSESILPSNDDKSTVPPTDEELGGVHTSTRQNSAVRIEISLLPQVQQLLTPKNKATQWRVR
ncbi:hypothetical protein IWQ62_000410 [Dispira parvispora]|uniref:Uncharacterized protein n=1 Tax=Dispira parvispora TaxID=1520584 RepID=A0A9W8E9P1_9FUNG|nr:hypothetical protein IWQ62_000410 [Dispira parvispora]